VLAAGIVLRRQLAVFALLISLPLTAGLLRHQGAGWIQAILVTISILPVFLATLAGHLFEIIPRLHQRLWPLQRIQITTNLARAALIAIALPLWPLAAVASLLAAVPQWWANRQLRRIADDAADWRRPADPAIRARLVPLVRRTMPGAIYYALSGQLTVWLISIFGLTSAVAAVGALGRLAMILSVLSAGFGVLAVPRFARIPRTEPKRVLRRYWQWQSLLALACAAPLLALASFPAPVLAILGPHYSGLEHEVVLMAASSLAVMMSGAAYSLAAARGVVAPPLLTVTYCIVGQVCLVLLLPLDSVAGVIWIGLLSAASQWLLHTGYFLFVSRRETVIVAA